MASREGFEPPTDGLEGRCSIQLSYRDICYFQIKMITIVVLLNQMASREGFEPPTDGLEGRCSIQLSYRDI